MKIKCFECGEHVLKFEQVCGMNILKEIDGINYYSVLCDGCGYYNIEKSKVVEYLEGLTGGDGENNIIRI